MKTKIRVISAVVILLLLICNVNIYFAKGNTENKEDIKIPILLYHNITEQYAEGTEGANMTPELFRQHMEAIVARGYNPIKLVDFYLYMIGDKNLPENPIVVTFDDGYLSNYEVVYPILKELNIPATIFVVTSTVGATPELNNVSFPHFTWEQAREMEKSGLIDIQSHSHTHRNMAELTLSELQTEIRLSKFQIERNLGKNCYIFSYPFGGYSADTPRFVKWAGYKMQVLVNDTSSGYDYLANKASDGLDNIKRLTVRGDMSVTDLCVLIDNALKNAK